jgi:hypothetical protein
MVCRAALLSLPPEGRGIDELRDHLLQFRRVSTPASQLPSGD